MAPKCRYTVRTGRFIMFRTRTTCPVLVWRNIINCHHLWLMSSPWRKEETDRWRHICANEHSWPDWKRRGVAPVQPFSCGQLCSAVQPFSSDQLCSIGADMTSATSLSLSIYNLLLYASNSFVRLVPDMSSLFSPLQTVLYVLCTYTWAPFYSVESWLE